MGSERNIHSVGRTPADDRCRSLWAILNLHNLKLTMAWAPSAALAGVISSDDIAKSFHDSTFQSPVLKLLSESKAKGYDIACIPLTNDKWMTRWKHMCLSPDTGEEKDENAERLSEAWRSNPVFQKDEVNITRLGQYSLCYISNCKPFMRRVDELENAIVMLSDWLELDSDDDWIRHDAETVSHLPTYSLIGILIL